MTWEIYSSADASAPQITTDAAGQLIAVLDAVLVNGYGSKSAAGWTKAFSGTNKAAYLQGAGSSGFYLRVDDATTVTARVVGYETMTDVDTGTNPFPTNAQVSGGLYVYKNNTAATRQWWIAADAKRFVLWMSSTTTETPETSTGFKNLYFFGDFISYVPADAYKCAIIANGNASDGGSSFAGLTAVANGTVAGHYVARLHTGVAGAAAFGKYKVWPADSSQSGATSGAMAYPDPVSGGLVLVRANVNAGSANGIRGYLPGVWLTPNSLPGAPGDTLTGTGALAGRTLKLMDAASATTRCRVAIEISNTIET